MDFSPAELERRARFLTAFALHRIGRFLIATGDFILFGPRLTERVLDKVDRRWR